MGKSLCTCVRRVMPQSENGSSCGSAGARRATTTSLILLVIRGRRSATSSGRVALLTLVALDLLAVIVLISIRHGIKLLESLFQGRLVGRVDVILVHDMFLLFSVVVVQCVMVARNVFRSARPLHPKRHDR